MDVEALEGWRAAALVVAAAAFLVVEALLVRWAWRIRTGRAPGADESRLPVRLSRAWELLWTLLPALGLLVLIVLGVRATWER